ncbi:MAG: lipopolysaccharide transport periplasmic protein LptA [Rhizobiaceae bacterium]|nr:lipopolysaccharide transport periplasmic protein LptA [Rhizobiaceae bacterium]
MRLLACIFFLIIGSTFANAQSASNAFKGMGNNDEPIQIEADKLEIIDNQNTALLTGNVSVVQGTTILKARQIKVFYLRSEDQSETNSGIRKIDASGKVAIRSEDNHVTADKASVDMVKEFVTLTGNVLISQGQNIVKGCIVTVDLKRNVSNVKPCGDTSSSGGRIKLLLDPKSRNTN